MPKKTLSTIVTGGNDYVIEVKGNQPKLFNQVKLNARSSSPIARFTTEENNRGRFEKRQTTIYDNISGIDPEWQGIKRIIKMRRSGLREGKQYKEDHYLVCSLETKNGQLVSEIIRSHWGIENRLHYVKDVNMNEDKSGIKGGHSAENLSIMKNIAINVYRYNGFQSLKYAVRKFTNRIPQQIELIRNTHILKLKR